MKNFDLNACGVAEMQQQEMSETNGGIFWLIPVVIGAGIIEIMSDWDNFERGFSGQPYQKK